MTSWMVKSVELFSSMSEKAASKKRWTRSSARERAAVRLRETARCRQSASPTPEAASSVTAATVPSPRPPALLERLDGGPVGVGGPEPGEGVGCVRLQFGVERRCGCCDHRLDGSARPWSGGRHSLGEHPPLLVERGAGDDEVDEPHTL